jgi:Tetratricopeptide repeat
MRPIAIILIALLGAQAPGAPPPDAVVQLELTSTSHTRTVNAIVLTSGYLLTTNINCDFGCVDSARVITADGRHHEVPGVVAFHRTAPILLLQVDWDGDPPAGMPVLNVDHFDTDQVNMVRAGGQTIRADVHWPGLIDDSIQVYPESFVKGVDWCGGAITNDDGQLLALIDWVEFGGSLPRASMLFMPVLFQGFACTPGAWVQPLLDSKRRLPISWADWSTTVSRQRIDIRRRIDDLRKIAWDDPAKIVDKLESLVDDDPWHPEAWELLARARLATDNPGTAQTAAERALEIDPGSHEATLLSVAATLRAPGVSDPRESMRRAIHMSHDAIRDTYLDAHYLYYVGLPDDALNAVDYVLKIDPTYKGANELKQKIERFLADHPAPGETG